MMTAKPTMATVADLAGVSTATVRRVLYEDGYVKASTREAVLEAVRKTSYRPNVFARGLRTRRSSVLAFISENELNPFFTKVAKSVQAEALRQGYTVLMLNHNFMADVEQRGIDQFADQHVAAIIFCAAYSPESLRRAEAAGIRVVQIEREVAPAGRIVLVDAKQGIRDAIAHLTQLGHKRIAYIGGAPKPDRHAIPVENTNEALRANAFRDAMAEAGLALPSDYVRLGGYSDVAGRPSDGARLMSRLLSATERPSAVVVGSDFIAAGALQAIHAAGLRVPDDISLIGYDDSMAELLTPPLTTLAQPLEELGRLAVELAIAPDDHVNQPSVRIELRTHLIVRQSTGRPRRQA